MDSLNNNLKRRWYDQFVETSEVFELLKRLDAESSRRLSSDLIEIVRQIKELHKEEDEVFSLGIERILGLYKFKSERRWYDKSAFCDALRSMSTLPTQDFVNIIEGLALSVR